MNILNRAVLWVLFKRFTVSEGMAEGGKGRLSCFIKERALKEQWRSAEGSWKGGGGLLSCDRVTRNKSDIWIILFPLLNSSGERFGFCMGEDINRRRNPRRAVWMFVLKQEFCTCFICVLYPRFYICLLTPWLASYWVLGIFQELCVSWLTDYSATCMLIKMFVYLSCVLRVYIKSAI